MDNATFQSILVYRTTMSIVQKMLEKGLISAEEYAVIDTKMAEKYDLLSSVIYR